VKKRVFITTEIPAAAYGRLSPKYRVTWNKTRLTEAQLRSKVGPYEALLTSLADPITPEVIRAAPKLRCIANCAVGFNNIYLETAREKRIWVTNTPEVLTEATADLTWALILSCARRVPEGERMVRGGKFKGVHALMLLGADLYGKTLGIYGFGRIGKAVARRGRGWDMKVLYHQRRREAASVEKRHNARYVSFEKLLRESDILSVHSPLTAESRHRFTREEFRKMRPKALFINASRGPIHREKDLAEALRKRWIFSAGLDVYENEPKVDPGLLKAQNCTLLPHIGSATVETRTRMALLAAENIDLALSGRKPKTPVFSL
jgi:glyoxylate reductase